MKKRTLALSLFLALSSLSYGCASNIKQEKDVISKVYEKVEKKYITDARAKWISRNIIAWKLPNYNKSYYDFSLNYSPNADIIKKDGKILGGKKVKLKFKGFIESGDPILSKYPYLKGYAKLDTSNIEQERLKPEVLRSNIVISVSNVNEEVIEATQIQNYGVLDDIYNYTKNDLGLTFNRFNQPTLKIWAPTAKSVKVLFFNSPNDVVPVKVRKLDEQVNEGVWTYSGVDEWIGMYYLYEVEVYSPLSGTVETNYVTDPYSLNLSPNGKKSQIVNLDEQKVKPDGWDNLKKPELKSFNDISLYELHVRDFSAKDESVFPQYRGKYMAFTEKNSNGMIHLKSLANSGLTHIHLLPISDFSSVQEEENLRKEPQELYKFPSDSFEQQKAVGRLRGKDAYNWGYDPQYFLAPEGSYATTPYGFARITELRSMVKSLNEEGLRVVMDVVFNHTSEAKDGDNSVLDKIVPGYYYRLDENGNHQNSSCCPDFATEHKMAGKLMVDAVKSWAKNYKIDGFRFDLMGHNTIENLQNIRKELDSLDPLLDGVDGKKIYLYGEGWKFGSLNEIHPDRAMNQSNSYGLGIGTFNDRIRDSLRGGNFSQDTKSDQGFLTGLYFNPNRDLNNNDTPVTPEAQKSQLANYTDNIKVGMAGNIKGFEFLSSNGTNILSDDVVYRNSQPTAYAKEPQETINYVSAHDNYVLWDQITAKVPLTSTSTKDKARIQSVGLSMIALSQGIPFFHAGDEILRSKSGDADSYDSGDWFNAIDFSYSSNNWGIGLPPEWKNRNEWDFWKKRLSMPELKVSKDDMLFSLSNFKRFLSIRNSSKLFRLDSSDQIKSQLSFLENESEKGLSPIDGLVVMYIVDKNNLDPQRKSVLSLFNSSNKTVEFNSSVLKGKSMELFPQLTDKNIFIQKSQDVILLPVDPQIQKAKFNAQKGSITVPPYTSLVYFEKE